jgi:SAM-dependent methyltransferase
MSISSDEIKNERWEHAQSAELRRFLARRMNGNEEDLAAEPRAEYLALGIDPLEVTGRIVDIGGSYGRCLLPFTMASERIVVDPLYDKLGKQLPGITGITNVGERLPFEDKSFDFVILRNVIDHAPCPEILLEEARRVLRPSGKMYFMVNVFVRVLKPLFFLMNRLDHFHPVHLTTCDVTKMVSLRRFHIISERTCCSGVPEVQLRRFVGWAIKREYHALLRLSM